MGRTIVLIAERKKTMINFKDKLKNWKATGATNGDSRKNYSSSNLTALIDSINAFNFCRWGF